MAERVANDQDIARIRQLVDAEKGRLGALMRQCETKEERSQLRLQYALLLDDIDIPDADFILWIAQQDPDLAQRVWGAGDENPQAR